MAASVPPLAVLIDLNSLVDTAVPRNREPLMPQRGRNGFADPHDSCRLIVQGTKRDHQELILESPDPRHVAAARELRDRWLERVNADPSVLDSGGKYDVSRQLEGAPSATKVESVPMLEAA